MGDSAPGSGPEENDAARYESIRSRPVTPAIVLKVNAGAGASRERRTDTARLRSPFQIHAHANTETTATEQVESYGLRILGYNAPGIEQRPLSSASRLRRIEEEPSANDFHTTRDEQGDILEVSDSFQKLKIVRNQPGTAYNGGGGGDGPLSLYSEDVIAHPPNGITIQSLTSNTVVIVPETHRSSHDSKVQQASSNDEIQVYPAGSQKSKLSKRRRKRRVKYPTSSVDGRSSTSMEFLRSIRDEDQGHSAESTRRQGQDREEEEESDVGDTERIYSSVPSTARSVMFHDFELMRPETASSEILADGTLEEEDEEQVKSLKSMFGIQDEDDWYSSRDETDISGKNQIRLLTKLFYRRFQKPTEQGLVYTHKLMLGGLHNQLEDFVLLSVPPGCTLKMRVTRVKKGVAGRFHPIYYMHLERDTPGDRKCLILVAKKHTLFGGTGYTLSTDPAELSTQSEYCVGKIGSNFIGTEFTLYSGRSVCSHIPLDRGALMALPKVERFKEELASVLYDPNVLGFKGPRKIKVIIPKMKNLLERESFTPRVAEETLFQRYQAEDNPPLWCLKNKDPIWNRDSHSYILNFAGRVHSASVKNFQIVCETNEEHVLLQFGRASENTFNLDFQYPFCPLQAFAIALTSFDSKLACE